jgi:leucyl-tRNA---protein transferase
MIDPPPLVYISEQFSSSYQSQTAMDFLWDEGWRHFGTNFFRYSLALYRDEVRRVIPLRIRLADLTIPASQRRVLKKNADLKVVVRPAEVTPEKEAMFARHKTRFERDVPDSIYDFLSPSPANIPCVTNEVCVYDGDRLIAVTFLGVGERQTSATYAMFLPEESARSLGIFMILKEAEYSINIGKQYLHLGYAYEGNSFYDYKKRFRALEAFDWFGNWTEFTPDLPGSVRTLRA